MKIVFTYRKSNILFIILFLQITAIIKSINTLFALIILLEHLNCLSVLFAGQSTHISGNVIALAYKTPR